MENETPTTPQKSSGSKMPLMIVAAVVVIIIVGAIVFMSSSANEQATETNQTQTATPTTSTMQQPDASMYQDGTYNVVGNYTSPGGEETINVTVTLDDGVVTSAAVVSNATRPISKQMQAAFIGSFEEQVVGKNIDEINVVKVSSSSLTPKGFMNALEKVKSEASA